MVVYHFIGHIFQNSVSEYSSVKMVLVNLGYFVVSEERNGEKSTREMVMHIYEDVTILFRSSKFFECRGRIVEKRADRRLVKEAPAFS